MEEKCPVCDSKIEENYCKNCAWEVFVFLNRENNREFEKYIERYETWKRIYNQSIEKQKEKVVYKEKTNKETISSNQNRDIEIIENGEIVIIDGLMYQNQPFKKMNWEEAKEYAKNLRLGGFNDWRLPTREELHKLGNIKLYVIDDGSWEKWFNKNKDKRNKNSRGNSFFIRKEFIKNINDEYGWFWTSEEKGSTGAWVVYFYNGNDYWHNKTYNHYVLCVRE